MSNPQALEIERNGHVATLWLNNPDRRNAMGPAFWDELPVAMTELENDAAVRAVVIAARGKDFTVGLDLKLMFSTITGGDGDQRFRFLDLIGRLQGSITAVAKCTKPVIAAIHGYCIGGGVDLVTACDIRYAARDTTFSIRETKMAMVADVGTLQRLPRIIGKGHVAELAFTGADFDAERAEELHLVNRVFADVEGTWKGAHDLAAEIAENSPLAVEGTKRVLDFCEDKTVEDGLRYVATWNAAFFKSEDLGEAIGAFTEKRKPSFKGK